MDLFVYSDESGVFDKKNNEYFVFGGLIFLSYKDTDCADRMYQHAENTVRKIDSLPKDQEAKACFLSPKSRGKLFRTLNNYHKFGVIVDQQKVLDSIFIDKKTKQRFLDYAFKIGIKRKFEQLINDQVIDPKQITRIRFYVDEHSTATNGKYELAEALEREFKYGTYNQHWTKFYPPIFPNLQGIDLKFCDSKTRTLIRAADILANKIYHCSETKEFNYLHQKQNMVVTHLP